MTIPAPRDHDEHAEPCPRHHVHMVNCPDCCAWHRHLLDTQRAEALQRQAQHEAAT